MPSDYLFFGNNSTKFFTVVWEATSKTCASLFIRGSNHLEAIKALHLRRHAFIHFSVVGTPNEILVLIFDLLHEQGSSTQSTWKLDYVDLLKYTTPCVLFAFTDNQSIRDDISINLSKLSGTVVQLYKKTKGRTRKELDGKVKKIHVHEGQVKSVRELLKEVEFMRDEIEEWKAK